VFPSSLQHHTVAPDVFPLVLSLIALKETPRRPVTPSLIASYRVFPLVLSRHVKGSRDICRDRNCFSFNYFYVVLVFLRHHPYPRRTFSLPLVRVFFRFPIHKPRNPFHPGGFFSPAPPPTRIARYFEGHLIPYLYFPPSSKSEEWIEAQIPTPFYSRIPVPSRTPFPPSFFL